MVGWARAGVLALLVLVMGLAPFLHTHLHPTERTGFHVNGLSLDIDHPNQLDDHDAVNAATASPPSTSGLQSGTPWDSGEVAFSLVVCAVLWVSVSVVPRLWWRTTNAPYAPGLHQAPNRPPPALAPPLR